MSQEDNCQGHKGPNNLEMLNNKDFFICMSRKMLVFCVVYILCSLSCTSLQFYIIWKQNYGPFILCNFLLLFFSCISLLSKLCQQKSFFNTYFSVKISELLITLFAGVGSCHSDPSTYSSYLLPPNTPPPPQLFGSVCFCKYTFWF